jgi:ribose transport system permease protein
VKVALGRRDVAGIGQRLQSVLREYGILVALALLTIIVEVQHTQFLTEDNLFNIGEQWAPVGIMAVGMTFVLIGGGFDLSVGATYAFSATLAASIAERGSPGLGLAAAVALGAGVGLVNGLVVTKLNVNPFVATLGMAQIVRGLALVYSDGGIYTPNAALFDTLGTGDVFGVPVPLLIMLAVFVFGGVILARSVYGRHVYAIGGNTEASYLSGIKSDAVRASTYVISGACAALAGAIVLGRVGSAQANIGAGIELDVIAAALIGGVSIAGGEGAMWRAAAGVTLLAFLQNFFNQANVSGFWQSIVKGGIIIMAVAADSYAKRPHRRPARVVVGEWLAKLGRHRGKEPPPTAPDGA